MFRVKITIIQLICLLMCSSGTMGQRKSKFIRDKVNWESFLNRHDLVWKKTPDDYFTAPFLGNGLLGAMFYSMDGKNFRMDIGRTDVVEHRDTEARSIVDNGRLPIGHFTLETNNDFKKATGRLVLYNAESNFRIYSSRSASKDAVINLRALVLRGCDAIMVEYDKVDELQCKWTFHPAKSTVPRKPKVGKSHLNPRPEIVQVDGINVCTQKRDAGGCYATAWKVMDVGKGVKRLFITIQDSYPGNEAKKGAIEIIKKLEKKSAVEELIAAHRDWWHNFYKASFVSIPHAKMESVYWIQQYKLASMMRKNGPLCDLMGPWYKPTAWPGIWFNLNTQLLYSSLHVSNQIELASTLPDYMIKKNTELIENVSEQWRYNSAGLARCSGPDLKESVLTWPNEESPERSNLIYLCYYLWEYYKVTMNDDYLSHHFFPLLRRAVNLQLHEVSVDEKGVMHTPYGHSPESTNDKDNNYDLSSLTWGCQTLLQINERLKLKDPLAIKWKEVMGKLRPFPVDENGFMCSAKQSAPLMHRHWCHLFQIYPYYLVNWEQPDKREDILKSIKHWGSPKIPNTWTQCAISSIYSSIGDSENALKHLDLALASPNFYPNTFHAEERNPCSETYGGLCRMLQDMLIQSWGNKIRVFPSVPKVWKDVVFHKLRAEGGFEVSARREAGKTIWIKIKSIAGEPCIIAPGFSGKFNTKGAKVKMISDGLYSVHLKKGKEAVLYVGDFVDCIVEPVEIPESEVNSYGLN